MHNRKSNYKKTNYRKPKFVMKFLHNLQLQSKVLIVLIVLSKISDDLKHVVKS